MNKGKLSMNRWDTKEGIKSTKKIKNLIEKPVGTIQISQFDLDFKQIMPIYNLVSRM